MTSSRYLWTFAHCISALRAAARSGNSDSMASNATEMRQRAERFSASFATSHQPRKPAARSSIATLDPIRDSSSRGIS